MKKILLVLFATLALLLPTLPAEASTWRNASDGVSMGSLRETGTIGWQTHHGYRLRYESTRPWIWPQYFTGTSALTGMSWPYGSTHIIWRLKIREQAPGKRTNNRVLWSQDIKLRPHSETWTVNLRHYKKVGNKYVGIFQIARSYRPKMCVEVVIVRTNYLPEPWGGRDHKKSMGCKSLY